MPDRSRRPTPALQLALCALFCVLSLALDVSEASAQFLQTDLNTYQLPDPKQEVIIVTTPRGMFVAQTPKRSGSLSGFDLDQLTIGSSTSVFLAYAPSSQVPEKLLLAGTGNEYRIRGTFSLQLSDDVRLAVSMNNGGVPFATVVYSRPQESAIIGFLGGQVVLNLGGQDAIELLEADVTRRRYNNVVVPYQIKQDNHLYLADTRLPEGSAVGLLSPQDNDCMLDGARFVPVRDYQDIFQLKIEEQQAALKKLLSESKKTLTLNLFLVLNASPARITAVNTETGKLALILPRELGDIKLCTVEPIVLKKKD